MKKLFVVVSILTLSACGSSKKKADPSSSSGDSSSMEQRVAAFMKLNEEMKFEEIMEYIYPKVFTIEPKEELLKAMKEGFDSDEVKIDIDSMKVDKIHPVFEMDNASYAKIDFSMQMQMDFTNSQDSAASADTEQSEFMRKTMAAQYGEENVSVDEATGNLIIRVSSIMVAVKEKSDKDWYFVNLKADDPMMTKIFSKEVIDKIGTYK